MTTVRIYDIAIVAVATAIVGVLVWPWTRGPHGATSTVATLTPPIPQGQARAAQTAPAASRSPLVVTVQPSGLVLENTTASPMENCLIQIFGGYTAHVDVIAAHGRSDMFYTVLFDSPDHEFEANLAGKPFDDFIVERAKTRTLAMCHDVSGQRVAAVIAQ